MTGVTRLTQPHEIFKAIYLSFFPTIETKNTVDEVIEPIQHLGFGILQVAEV